MRSLLNKVLTIRGLHYLLTRFGPQSLQRLSFDQKFIDGDWKFSEAPSSVLVSLLEKYAAGGDVLMLGCGTGSIVRALRPGSFASFTGVDLSPAAIAIASSQAGNEVRFEVGNMRSYRCKGPVSVILLSESLYYVHPLSRVRFLRGLSKNLTPEGRIIVTISQSTRFARLLTAIRRSFSISEDQRTGEGERHVIVLR